MLQDKLNASSEQDMCDQDVTTIIHEDRRTRPPTGTGTQRSTSSISTDPYESAPSPITGLVYEKT